MMEARKTQTRAKSKIAVKKGSTLQNKENVPNNASKKGVEKNAAKPPTGRKTLSNRKDDNSQEKPVTKLKRAKTAPDFDKLHKKWKTKLAKGKAVTKRSNTKIEAFNLTNEVNGKLEDIDLDEDLLEVEVDEPVDILHEESEIVQEITTACCSCRKQKSQREQVTTPAPTNHEFKVPKSIRKTNLSSVKTKEKKVEIEEDLFEFKPDNNALQSILNNDGIRSTPSKRNTGAYCSPSPFNQKRTSIYYTGPRPDRSPSAFEKRLSMRRAAATMAKMRQPENNYEPSNTLIGIQEIGNRFTAATTPLKELENDHNTNPECIPEETSEDKTTLNTDTIAHATDSSHAFENEISWADTLKYYSQSQQENCSPVEEETAPSNDQSLIACPMLLEEETAPPGENEEEDINSQLEEEDKEALISQLEEEVRQTLSNIALTEHTNRPREQHSLPYPSAGKTETEIIRNSKVSIPLQQRRDKPSIYRKLFASPSNVQSKQPMIETKVLNPAYLHTATSSSVNVPRSYPYESSDVIRQDYPTKPAAIHMPGSGSFSRLPIDSPLYSLPTGRRYTTERYKIPLGKSVTFSPSVAGRNPECNLVQERGIQSASKIGTSTLQGFETSTSSNTWVAEPAVKGNDGSEYIDTGVVKGIFTRPNLQGFESATSSNTWVAEPAFMKKDGTKHINAGVFKGISTRSTLNGLENSTSGSLPVAEPTIKEKEGTEYMSLVAAASVSLNSKLRRKAYETRSAFKRTLPLNVETINPPSATNPCTPTNERKILVPTPMKPVVARNDLLSQEMAPNGFISRHRQIMRDALMKSRDHAQEVLLDAEVSLYARNIEYLRKYDDYPRLINPLAKLFNDGDERHFVPVLA